MYTPFQHVAPVMAFVAAEAHFILLRVHGDCRGGKHAPTLFVLLLHALASLGGSPAPVTLSLHRILIVWTYLLTGLRKMYCVGLRWCDGENLQVILRVQGLYHDAGSRVSWRGGWNFLLARSRTLCCVGSVLVVALQILVLPLCLALPQPAARTMGFTLALSFHAANLILWRINFFVAWCPALLALAAPGEQLPAHELMHAVGTNTGALAAATVVVLFLLLQLGHAMDGAAERFLAASRNRIVSSSRAGKDGKTLMGQLIHRASLGSIWLLELHCLGDYYSAYWPTAHPLSASPTACLVCIWPDGSECLMPAITDFYFRRDMNAGVQWPKTPDGSCLLEQREGWSDLLNRGTDRHGNARRGRLAAPSSPPLSRPMGEVLHVLQRLLEESFVGRAKLHSLTSGPTPVAIVLRARVLEADRDGAVVIKNLWDRKLEFRRQR